MTLHGHLLRDCRRVSWWRASLRPSTVTRVAVLTGLSGIAWFAAVTAAHAGSASGVPIEDAQASDLVAVTTAVAPSTAGSELAARAPDNQPETVVESILATPTRQLGDILAPRAEPNDVDASADAIAMDTAGSSTSNEIDQLHGTAPTARQGSTPIVMVSRPLTSNLISVTSGVGDVIGGVARPVSETVRPVNSVITGLAPTQGSDSSMFTLPVLREKPKSNFGFSRIDSGASAVHARATAAGAPDESGDWHVTGVPANEVDVRWVHDAFARHSDPISPPIPLHADPGRDTAGVAPSGGAATGSVLADNGVGHPMPTRLDGAAGSRVTPRTAVFGQLPDHVTDPAVSPD